MRQGIEKLHNSLEAAKIQHVYSESQGTDHEWQTWHRNLQDFAHGCSSGWIKNGWPRNVNRNRPTFEDFHVENHSFGGCAQVPSASERPHRRAGNSAARCTNTDNARRTALAGMCGRDRSR
jgi:hypothetical protein